MAFIRRRWTPEEADEWRKEDWMAIILSPLAYTALAVGVALSLLALVIGYIILAVGIGLTLLLFYVIDPKLKAVSAGYETKQKEYLENLDKIVRWED